MDRKLIFLDIDGTLTADMAPPSARTRDAVRRARAAGHKVFLCTGRNAAAIGGEILEIGFDGMVASAGCHVEADGRVLFDSLLSETMIQRCLSVFHSHQIYCRIESPEGIFTDPQMESLLLTADPAPSDLELIRMQRELQAGIRFQSYEKYPGRGAYKISFTSTNLENIERTKRYLGRWFQYVVHPYKDCASCFNGEILQKGIHKGSGMEMICRHFGMRLQDAVAFGDSMNDYEMISCAGISVAMGNACQELKNIADIVCETAWEDGVYHQFYRMGLLQNA